MAIELQIQEENRLTLEIESSDSTLLSSNEAYITFANDYDQLTNKPQINDVTLEGNKTLEELGYYAATYAGEEDNIAVFSGGEVIWEDPQYISVGKAAADGDGNNIASTYSKDAYFTLDYITNHEFTLLLHEVSSSNTAINYDTALKNPVKLKLYGSHNGEGLITSRYQTGVGTILTVMFADAINFNNETIAGVSFTYSYVRPGTFTATFYNVVYPWDASKISNIEQNIDELSRNVEYTSNKVTSISSESTDTQYPSAKAVYDEIQANVFSGDYNDLTNKPTIPTKTSELLNDGSDDTSTYVEASDLATVATSGSYDDLLNKPTIPAAQVNSDWNASSGVAEILNKPALATVATSGSYTDLSNKPTIPAAGIPGGGNAGQILKKTTATDYDVNWADQTQYYPSGYSTTGSDKQTKQIACSAWAATANTYLHILLTHANTYAGKIYFTVNAVNTYEVWINGAVSSSTNYSLPAGSYIIFFDGSEFQIRTDGLIPASITGTAAKIPYGKCNSTSTSTAFTATVPGITELKDGTTMLLYNGVVTSASGFTINVNGLGAKPSYNNMTMGNPVTPTNPTRDTTIFNINYAFLFVYSETLVSGGCWIGYRGYDANTNTIGYQLRTNSSTMKASAKFYRYRLLFTSADGTKWVPANTSTLTNATSSREVNQTPIDPFGEIVWYGTTTAIDADATVTAAQLWQEYAGSYSNIGYSFNRTGAAQTMTTNEPIYIKCAPQADGSAIIDATTPYVQALPTTEDGKIYIYLGRAYSATNFEITMNHPVYYHDGTGIRIWTGVAGLPAVSSADEGKILKVINGVWTAVLPT